MTFLTERNSTFLRRLDRFHRAGCVCGLTLLMTTFVVGPASADEPADATNAAPPRRGVVVRVPDASRVATLHASGQRVHVPIEDIWRPMCSGHRQAMTEADLLGAAADSIRRQIERGSNGPAVEHRDDGGLAGGGFNMVFQIDASVPPEAQDALDRVELFFEQLFADDVTVRVNVEFDDGLPGGVLGATSTPFTVANWNASRNGLQNGMDESDFIQDYLPPNSKIPVRYNGNSAFVTQENRVFWTIANFNATIGFVAGDAGTLRFNEDITWDYEPDDGVVGFSFIDVVIHEVGHALGFASGVDFRDHDIEALDIFRFQRTDGAFDYNPDTHEEFRTTPRLASYNLPNRNVIVDIRQGQFKMEDGFPYQASHFFDKSPPIGLMDPVLGGGQTFAPNFLRPADRKCFDAIGWDR